MSKVVSPAEFFDIGAVGPVAQCFPAPAPAFPATLDPAGGAAPSWISNLMPGGFKSLAVGVTLSRTGTLKINRYIDDKGVVLLKTDSVALVANTANTLTIVDGLPFGSFTVEIDNTDATGGHTAVISAYALCLNAS